MKTLIILAFALSGITAQAANYQCTAQGYDSTHLLRRVRGGNYSDQFGARQSALRSCRIQGWTGCHITFCFHRP